MSWPAYDGPILIQPVLILLQGNLHQQWRLAFFSVTDNSNTTEKGLDEKDFLGICFGSIHCDILCRFITPTLSRILFYFLNPLTPKRWKIPNDFVKIPVHLFSVRLLKFFLGCIHPCCSCLDLGCLVTHLPPPSQQSQHHGWKTQT